MTIRILAMLAAALYLGVAGWVVADFDAGVAQRFEREKIAELDVCFHATWSLQALAAREVAERTGVGRWVGWAFRLPPGGAWWLTAAGFGLVGGLLGLVRHRVASSLPPVRALAGVGSGLAAGMAVAVVAAETPFPPGILPAWVLAGVCLLGGALGTHACRVALNRQGKHRIRG